MKQLQRSWPVTICRASSSYETQFGVPRDSLYESTYCGRTMSRSFGFDALRRRRIAELVVLRVDRRRRGDRRLDRDRRARSKVIRACRRRSASP